jgi:hypothetical protein
MTSLLGGGMTTTKDNDEGVCAVHFFLFTEDVVVKE